MVFQGDLQRFRKLLKISAKALGDEAIFRATTRVHDRVRAKFCRLGPIVRNREKQEEKLGTGYRGCVHMIFSMCGSLILNRPTYGWRSPRLSCT